MIAIIFFLFFFNDTATTEIYTLSLHDSLPIYILKSDLRSAPIHAFLLDLSASGFRASHTAQELCSGRSEEHTSELQSRLHLVCRLLLEKKKNNSNHTQH